jgi:hypothetical protein
MVDEPAAIKRNRHCRHGGKSSERETAWLVVQVSVVLWAEAMPAKKKAQPKRNSTRWSADVTKHSNALDLDRGVFTWKDPARIAASLKRSAQTSKRRKSSAYRSALSMLTFHINRAGTNLPADQKKTLEKAKTELRRKFGRA